MGSPKIATCCYCGTRAMLVPAQGNRHTLSCGSCGAPLQQIKRLRTERVMSKPTATSVSEKTVKRPKVQKPKKVSKRRRKGIWAKLVEEAWDTVEDIFD